jgi:16S rRNA (cytidine1402-2'-O)-methyltransferase
VPIAGVAARAQAELARILQEPLSAGLYLVATPIGNLADITLRAAAVLARAAVVYCEDTRHSRTLLSHFGIAAPTRPYHEHNAEAERPRILDALAAGKAVALISDAGTPLVSDPGFKLVRAVLDAGHRVESVPGASAVLAGLSVSGLPTDAFFFAGFLPPKQAARRTRIAELATIPGSLILFEAPTRLAAALADLAAGLGDRPAAVTRELTKRFEEARRGGLVELAAHYVAHDARGEIVIVVAPPGEIEVTDDAIRARLDLAMESMSLSDAARLVAAELGVAKSRVYDLGLQRRRGRE